MNRPTSFLFKSPVGRSTGSAAKTTRGVSDYLRAHDKMAALLPAAARLATLQKDCAAILPALFDVCSVMQFDAGQLVLASPNAAMASKAKQQLPKLQESLLQRGWQVNAIKIKVQVRRPEEKPVPQKRIALPPQAISALAELRNTLEDSPQNEALKSALESLLQRHRNRR
jgi:hypothetical protein